MKLSVPFIPDKKYTDFLFHHQSNLASVYFPFPVDPILDARMRITGSDGFDDLMKHLAAFESIKKYALLNTRFIHPTLYSDADFLHRILDGIKSLFFEAGLTGIVFCDVYLLNALAATDDRIVSQLEAVPGINCLLDSSQKIFALLDFISQSGFKSPEKIILDRSLNRDINLLEKTVSTVRKNYSDMKFELMANEGCISHCPFKLTHDAQISLANIENTSDNHHTKNLMFPVHQTLGCHSYFFSYPWRFLASPFIRPEDLVHYSDMTDSIKICGRTLGINFLIRCIAAYSQKSYDGNLLDLMDAANWLGELYRLDNKKLAPDFFNTVTLCTKNCKQCSICDALFKKAAVKQSIGLKSYKDYL